MKYNPSHLYAYALLAIRLEVAMSNVAKEISKEFKPGYRLEQRAGSSHYVVMLGDRVVRRRDSNLPLSMPASPKSVGTLQWFRRVLKREGVIA